MANKSEVKQLRRRIAVMEGQLRAIHSDVDTPDFAEKMIQNHREQIRYHIAEIRKLRKNQKSPDERKQTLARAIVLARRKLKTMTNDGTLRKIARLEKELAELKSGE